MFPGWGDFFFLLGSAAAGLIGLLFVVVTLTSGTDRSQAQRGANLYMTPTAYHFGVTLFVSALAIAPALPAWAEGAIFTGVAFTGLFYAFRSTFGIRTVVLNGEPPHWTDRWFYGFAPAAVYAAMFGAALAVWTRSACAPMALGGVLLVLLLLGIRNAWDLVTWIAPTRPASGS